MKKRIPQVLGLLVGCVAAVIIAKLAFGALRAAWPAYVLAEPTKAYSLAMLFSRLGIGVLCTAGAAVLATLVAKDSGSVAWWLGGLFLAISIPPHLYTIWDDYPGWYHFVYLGYLMPVAGLSGRFVSRRRSSGVGLSADMASI